MFCVREYLLLVIFGFKKKVVCKGKKRVSFNLRLEYRLFRVS